MHSMKWVWLIMVPPLVVSHVNWDGCVKRREEVVGTCERKEERKGHKLKTMKYSETNAGNDNDETFLKAVWKRIETM